MSSTEFGDYLTTLRVTFLGEGRGGSGEEKVSKWLCKAAAV